MTGQAEAEFENGTPRNVVLQILEESGLSSIQASEVMELADKRVSRAIRRQAIKRITAGVFALAGAVIVGFVVPMIGAFCLVFGIGAIGSGVYSLLSGRDLSSKKLE